VEFDLEDDITDEEAEKLIEEPLPSSDDLAVSDQFTVTSNETDLFTARLMRYEVQSTRLTIKNCNLSTNLKCFFRRKNLVILQ